MRTEQKIYWLATYGDMGLEVSHFNTERKCRAAVRKAEAEHASGSLDSYTWGSETVALKLDLRLI